MDGACGSARDRLGRTLGGKYHLREVLGAGGTAVVYRATDNEGSTFAIKVLHDHLSRSEEVCRRFIREGQLGNVLDHPNTIRVLDYGSTEEQCPYLVLEFLEGESLEDRRVRAGGRLDMWETLDYCDQLLAVLEVAHAKNIVHRDIKPSNLFVMKTGVLKVLDFGIARLTDDTSATSTKTGQMVGTPAFMPPEQALSRPRDIDARTDIWSVGATLFTLLSGEHVHIAETSSEHLVKAATLHSRSLARALPGVPANVEALVAKCLAFDKSERWASATEMRAELAFVRDDPGRRVGTSTSPPPERVPSSANLPTVMGSARDYMSGPAFGSMSERDVEERTSETNMSLVSNPGGYGYRPRRRWLLPFAIASTVLLMIMTVLVAILAVRPSASDLATAAKAPVPTPTPTEQAPTEKPVGPESAPPTDDVLDLDSTPPTAKTAVAPVTTPKASVSPPTIKSATKAAPSSSFRRPQPLSSARRDIYKPF